jgi:tetratricopeptide (TPR) repeat protein
MDLGTLDRPDNLERALALFEELGDLPGTAGVLNMLGGLAYYKGDWEQASALYLRAQATVRRTGNEVMNAFYVFNLGEIARDQGHLDEAERALTSALRSWRAAGYRSGTAYAKGMLARVASWQHRYDDALRLFQESIEELSDVGSRGDLLEVQAGLAECLLLSRDTAGALSLVDETISEAHALGGMAPQIPGLYRVRGAALAVAGDGDGARESLRQSLRAAETREVEYEAALTMRVLAVLETDPREQELMARSASQILAKLKVVWTPDLLRAPTGGPTEVAARPGGRDPVRSASSSG